MRQGIIIAIVAILGLSTIGFGQMTGYGNNNNDNDWYNFWHYFDYNKLFGFMNSGGNNNDDDDDDDDDDDNNDDDVDQSPIDHANISFGIGTRPLALDGSKKQNVVDECIFSSEQTFGPLCIECKFLDEDGKTVVATGKEESDDDYPGQNSEVIIEMKSEPPVDEFEPAFNDVRNVHAVELVICGFKDKCPDDRDKCKCDERKKDHAEHYYNFYKRYEDKNKFGKAEYSKFINDLEDYIDEKGKYMDRSDFKTFMEYHEKILKDNKKSFSSKDYNQYSEKHKEYSRDYPKHQEKCECDDQNEDHERDYYDSKEYYDKNKNKFGKGGHSEYMNDLEDYIDEEGQYMDSSTFKMFMEYHEKILKDNKKSFSSKDYNHHSEKHKEYSRDYPNHQEEEDECKEKSGFFTGGGKVYAPKYGGGTFTVTHGKELHCDATQKPNNLEVNWAGNKFHLEQLVKATCIDNPSIISSPPPSPHPGPSLDTYTGEGYGRYNGVSGAYAEWSMTDEGEPGTKDKILYLKIYKTKGGENVLNINSPLSLQKGGNNQFVPHPASHPHS